MRNSQGRNLDPPVIPDELMENILKELDKLDAPFLKYLDKELTLEWLPDDESRLGVTRFEMEANELYRRRRLNAPPGKITIGLNSILVDDYKLLKHTLAHEILHAVGLLDHDGIHSKIVNKVAPPPKLKESIVLKKIRQEVLAGLPERQWICGSCGFTWERKRVTRPTRCPKCAKPFKA